MHASGGPGPAAQVLTGKAGWAVEFLSHVGRLIVAFHVNAFYSIVTFVRANLYVFAVLAAIWFMAQVELRHVELKTPPPRRLL